MQIHERLIHHKIVTAWASHHEVGFCRTPTYISPFEATLEASLMQQMQQEGQTKLLP